MARGAIDDPLKVFRYLVEIDGVARVGFSKVSGLTKETEVVSYREGGQNETEEKSPGLTTYPDVTLERGQFANSSRGGDDELFNWSEQVSSIRSGGNARQFRRDVTIVQLGADLNPARRWTIRNAWISKYTPASDFDASQSANSFETIVLTHEGFELQI